MTGGTWKRIGYATPTAEQQARVVTTRICPVCQQPRQVKAGRIAPHQRSRDECGQAIAPPVWCAGAGQRALAAGAAAWPWREE